MLATVALRQLMMTKTAAGGFWGNLGRGLWGAAKYPFKSGKPTASSWLGRRGQSYAKTLSRLPVYTVIGGTAAYGLKHLDPDYKNKHLMDVMGDVSSTYLDRLNSGLPDIAALRRAVMALEEPKPSVELPTNESPAGQAKEQTGAGGAEGEAPAQPGMMGQAWDWISNRPEVYIPGVATLGSLGLYGLYRMLRSRNEDEDEEA